MSASKPKLKTGQLTLRVHKAQKLYDTQTLGKQDPFVSLQLGEWKKQTKVSQDSGREGVWEEEYVVKLTGFEKELKIEVNHKGLVGQDFIGRCDLPMSQFLWGELAPTWYRLGRDVSNNVFAGEIMLSAKFVDDDKTQENKEKAAQEMIAALQGKVEFLEAAIRQKETDLAEEEVAHSKAMDALKIEIAELKEKNAKLTAEAGKVAGLEKKVEQMIPDPVVEECYENFRYAPLKGWKTPYLPTDRWAWSNRQGTEERTKDMCRLPNQDWKWSNDWAVDTTRVGVDKEGFEYAKDFSTEWHSSNTKLDTVRRRRWIRRREYVVPK